MIAINLSKQEVLDVDLKTMQQINFIRNLARDPNVNTTIIFIIEEATEIILDFSEGTVILWMPPCNLATACSENLI